MKQLRHIIILIALTLAWEMPVWAQDVATQKLSLSLDEAIMMARRQSVDASVALNELKTSYWEYRTYRADLLPEVNFQATLPSYNKDYTSYQLEDGTYTYIRNNYIGLNGTLSVDQNIPLTGGTVSLKSSLDYLGQLDGAKDSRYMSIPVALTLTQPIFAANSFKWNRRIEPLRYQEAQAKFLESTEEVAMKAVEYYFNLLMAEAQVSIATQNQENADKLYEVALAKRKMGQISKNDVLQLELNKLDATSALTNARSTYKNCMFRLRSFLGLGDNVEIVTVIPEMGTVNNLAFTDVLDKALTNNSFSRNIRRRQLEADYSVAKAKGDQREVTLFAQVGFTGTDNSFSQAYRGLKDNQVIEIGVEIPILDWGKRRGKVKVAESNREVEQSRIRQESMNFRQDLYILVERFNNQQEQVAIAMKADTIARQRYASNVETFMLGKISTLDLNDSQTRKDETRSQYISQLFQYWHYFYQLRSLTLWDFTQNRNIDADFNHLVK